MEKVFIFIKMVQNKMENILISKEIDFVFLLLQMEQSKKENGLLEILKDGFRIDFLLSIYILFLK